MSHRERASNGSRAGRIKIHIAQVHCSLRPTSESRRVLFQYAEKPLEKNRSWTEKKLGEALTEILKSEAFSKQSMTKLFRSVIFGGPNPGERLRS